MSLRDLKVRLKEAWRALRGKSCPHGGPVTFEQSDYELERRWVATRHCSFCDRRFYVAIKMPPRLAILSAQLEHEMRLALHDESAVIHAPTARLERP